MLFTIVGYITTLSTAGFSLTTLLPTHMRFIMPLRSIHICVRSVISYFGTTWPFKFDNSPCNWVNF